MSVNPVLIIEKKRDGHELSSEELRDFIKGIAAGTIEDYQATAFLMATFFQGMTPAETVALTKAMLESGERIDLSSVAGTKVDKHSTGGVGDKVSLILAPLAAACGLIVPMMAGRGLGHSGGTLDKLESIEGFQVQISKQDYIRILKNAGCAIIGQTASIVPADKKLYSLRDVTGTVPCVPLICGSILSKKLAEGTNALLLDVKVGSGAFMKTLSEAKTLAKSLITVAKKMGLPARALITDMNQPLGYAVGNSLEVLECIEILRGSKPASSDLSSVDLRELTLTQCAHMLVLGKKAKNLKDGRILALKKLQDGTAWEKFRSMVSEQGGNLTWLDEPNLFPKAPIEVQWKSKKRGYLKSMDTEALGKILVDLGGGRKRAADPVDPAVGIWFHAKLGAKLTSGQTIATVFARDEKILHALEQRFQASLEISGTRPKLPPLVHAEIT
ncbi:MAG: thymidine phosphorylase [Bdellovibrionales bacterium]|nr:thymidine phosphorylase [Bdellovibrionales bacterium]